MSDRITANLPSRDFDETAEFYSILGFTVAFRDEGWMILRRGELEIEFFPHRAVDPASSWFSACVRVSDLDKLFAAWRTAELPATGIPRLTPPVQVAADLRIFALVDPNGSLLRCISRQRVP